MELVAKVPADVSRTTKGANCEVNCLFPSSPSPAGSDIATHIFRSLHHCRDIGNARQVCRRWAELIPSSIARLDLSTCHNLLQCSLISALPSFSALKALDLSPVHNPRCSCKEYDSFFSDPLLEAIAQHCPRLERFCAGGDNCEFSAPAIAALLNGCPQLHTLILKATSPDLSYILPPSPVHSSLRSLTLDGCILPWPRDMPLLHLGRLEELHVQETSVQMSARKEEVAAMIADLFFLISQLENLTRLTLSIPIWLHLFRVRPNTEHAQILLQLEKLTKLQSLTLHGVPFNVSVPSSWPRVFPALRSLRLLSMKRLSGIETAFSMKQLTQLVISGSDLSEIPTELGAMTNLRSFGFMGTSYLSSVPASINQLTSLTVLDFSMSQSLVSLPELSGLVSLHTLRLCGLHQLMSLPSGIECLPKLCLLNLAGCDNLSIDDLPKGPGGQSGNLKIIMPNQRHRVPLVPLDLPLLP